MKIAVCSDLHLEFGMIELKNTEEADVLVLSGDILIADDFDREIPDFNPYASGAVEKMSHRTRNAIKYMDFLKQISSEFPHVIVIAGNHEFYNGKWVKSLSILRELYARHDNIHFLEDEIFKLDDVTFVGATLWTDMNKVDPLTLHAVGDMMNDFRIIRNDEHGYTKLRAAHAVHRHRKSLGYIKQVVSEKHDEKFVIVGHHAPSVLSISEDYKNEYLMNGAYYSDLSEFILDRPQIKLWTCGHVHHQHWYYMGDTLVACNPRGYPNERPDYANFKCLVIDLDDMPTNELVSNNYNHSII